MSITETKLEHLDWGDKVWHKEFGEGIVIRKQIGLLQIMFKQESHKPILCKVDDENLKHLEADF